MKPVYIYIIEIKRNSLKYTILVFKSIETREKCLLKYSTGGAEKSLNKY